MHTLHATSHDQLVDIQLSDIQHPDIQFSTLKVSGFHKFNFQTFIHSCSESEKVHRIQFHQPGFAWNLYGMIDQQALQIIISQYSLLNAE